MRAFAWRHGKVIPLAFMTACVASWFAFLRPVNIGNLRVEVPPVCASHQGQVVPEVGLGAAARAGSAGHSPLCPHGQFISPFRSVFSALKEVWSRLQKS